MKKTALLAIASLFIFSVVNAQISKGSTFLGGSVGYSKSSNELTLPQQTTPAQENEQSSWTFRPQFGKAIADNQIMGIFLNFFNSNSQQKNGANILEMEGSNYGGGIFYRRYYPFSQRFYLFGDAALGVSSTKQQITNDNGTINYTASKNNGTNFSLALTPGLSFAATRKLFLEASLNDLLGIFYSTTEGNNYNSQGVVMETTEQTSFSAMANANGFSNISIGVRWILPSKK
jgi:opacity protein-like surface antigen